MSKTPNTAPNATRANEQKVVAQAASSAKQVKAAKAEPKPDPKLGKKIKLVAEKNPKREGSASHARFALYRNDITVEAYLEACVKKGQQRRAARADIDWDTKRKFIELVD